MPKIFSHIDLRVPDLAAVDTFYRTLLPALGFIEEEKIEGWLQFRTADGSEFFGITESPGHTASETRIAFQAPSKADIDRLAAIAVEAGARNVEGPLNNSDVFHAVFFEDPCGNRLEICHRY